MTPTTGVTGSFQYATAPYSYNYTMPSGELDLLLTYHRDPSKWVKLTYLPGNGGTLGADPAKVSPDVHAGSASGSYEVDVTKQGASTAEGYSFAEVKTKRLVPTVTATDAPYYRFKGFIVNDNGNGILDSGEHLVSRTTSSSRPTRRSQPATRRIRLTGLTSCLRLTTAIPSRIRVPC